LVVVEVDVGSDPGLELGEAGEAVPVEELVLEDGPEALGAGTVNRQLPVAPIDQTRPAPSQKATTLASLN
jgi:hypothetical protein